MHSMKASETGTRPGMVLLAVLAFLSLFAVVAISFVFYADSEALAASYHRQSLNRAAPDADPELLLAYFLKQFLFDAKDDPSGVYSALRGHSLMRTAWGSEYNVSPNGMPQLGN